MRTIAPSVFRVANPMPGKCFIVASAPRSPSPRANAFARRVVVPASNDHVLPCRYMKDAVEAGTSATGARSVFTPSPSSAAPVLRPCRRAISAEPILGGEIVGGIQGMIFTPPPS